MEFVNLGSPGLKVSPLCLGAMTYGEKSWRDWVLSEEEARPFLKRTLDLGINFLDTADIYSLGRSEEILGKALADFRSPPSAWSLRPRSSTPWGLTRISRATRGSTSRIRSTAALNGCAPTRWISIRSTGSITRPPLKRPYRPYTTSFGPGRPFT